MQLDTLNMIAAFMQRVQLQGNEAPAYMKCLAALQAEADEIQAESIEIPQDADKVVLD